VSGLYRTIKALSGYASTSPRAHGAHSAWALRAPALYLINCTLRSCACIVSSSFSSSASNVEATTNMQGAGSGGGGGGGGGDGASFLGANPLAHRLHDKVADHVLPALWSDEQELGLGQEGLILTSLLPQPSPPQPSLPFSPTLPLPVPPRHVVGMQ